MVHDSFAGLKRHSGTSTRFSAPKAAEIAMGSTPGVSVERGLSVPQLFRSITWKVAWSNPERSLGGAESLQDGMLHGTAFGFSR